MIGNWPSFSLRISNTVLLLPLRFCQHIKQHKSDWYQRQPSTEIKSIPRRGKFESNTKEANKTVLCIRPEWRWVGLLWRWIPVRYRPATWWPVRDKSHSHGNGNWKQVVNNSIRRSRSNVISFKKELDPRPDHNWRFVDCTKRPSWRKWR